MATAHFIYGSTGAGKTTKSIELLKKSNAIVFSIDEWMKTLFWKDSDENTDLDWALERVARCEDQIWKTAKEVLSKNISVVFDLGFSKREQREKFKDLLRKENFKFEVHFLDIDVEIRKKRVQERNLEQDKTQSIYVSDETFDWMETYFEKPGDDEL